MQRISILGATGSIGDSTLDVIGRHPEQFEVFALSCHRQVEKLLNQAKVYHPQYLVITDADAFKRAKQLAQEQNIGAELLFGEQALVDIVSASEVDTVMAAIVGSAGLLPTLAAVQAGKKVLLANKEALVMSGNLFIEQVQRHNATLLPIDSEHNAIFQCLPADFDYGNTAESGISKILLTGSGGPFLTSPLHELMDKTPDQACAHPNWQMGRKISVDSATMMNKGLEFIEACWLFGVKPEQIDVVIHPQSVIHSMVQYQDGSVLAQLGNPDMRTPIAHALAYPKRISAGVKPLDFSQMTDFTFDTPDFERFANLRLAIEASKCDQYASTALNASNEVAVEAFLQLRIGFTDIARLNQQVLDKIIPTTLTSIDDVVAYDQQVRALADTCLQGWASC